MDAKVLTEIFWMILLSLVIVVPVILILTRKTDKKQLLLLLHIFLVLWAARIWVSFRAGIYDTELSFVEKLFDSFLHALQSFSMDEDYTLYTVKGKDYLDKTLQFAWLPGFYGLVISVLNACAVIMGGAVVLNILLDFFPSVRIWLGGFRHKFVFSELNRDAVTLAEDILAGQKYKNLISMKRLDIRPMIIFAGAGNEVRESSPELYSRAQNIGAVCIRHDVLQLMLKRSKSVNYFLIDQDAHANISTLDQLLEPDAKGKLRWPMKGKKKDPITRIFVFGQDDSGNALVRQICAEHEMQYEHVVVRPIQDLMNAALNLMYEVPLFLPLQSRDTRDRSDLYLTVLGSGPLAEEVLKAGYWCGQMDGVRLHVNVLAADAAQMKQRMEERYPEMLKVCKADSELLRIYPHDPQERKNPPYCETMEFHDVADLAVISKYPAVVLAKTDYYVVALDTDEQNIQLAEQLKVKITRELYQSGSTHHPVIAPAVEDHRIAQAAQCLLPDRYHPYVTPFASRENRYSCKNVFLSSFTEREISIKSLYHWENQNKDQKDHYATQSSAARAVHAPYKLFGMGLLKDVNLTDDIATRYKISQEISLTEEQDNRFAWVEHRRWNAYIRTQGFTRPTEEQYRRIFEKDGLEKSIPLKLHPCLVESQVERKQLKLLDQFNDPEYDYLDYVNMYTYRLHCEKEVCVENLEALRKRDKKKYDYLKEDAGIKSLLPEKN